MKTVAKLFADLLAWRWAPAAGLLAATTLLVMVVVGLVPSEIGVPVSDTKFVPRTLSTSVSASLSDTTTASFANNQSEQEPVTAAPSPPSRPPTLEFGRRGFSPRLDRPDPPAPPVQAAQINPMPPQRGPISGIFSRIQGALRPGSQIATAAVAPPADAPAAPPAAPAAPDPAAAAAPAPPPADAPAPPAEPAAPPGPPTLGAPPTYPGAPPPADAPLPPQ